MSTVTFDFHFEDSVEGFHFPKDFVRSCPSQGIGLDEQRECAVFLHHEGFARSDRGIYFLFEQELLVRLPASS